MFANHVATLEMATYAGAGMMPQGGDAPYRTDETITHFTMGSEANSPTFFSNSPIRRSRRHPGYTGQSKSTKIWPAIPAALVEDIGPARFETLPGFRLGEAY